jgi:hypothetical protein
MSAWFHHPVLNKSIASIQKPETTIQVLLKGLRSPRRFFSILFHTDIVAIRSAMAATIKLRAAIIPVTRSAMSA